MSKKDKIKRMLIDNKEGDFSFLLREIKLLLENNYGSDIQFLFSLIETEKEEFSDDGCFKWRELVRREATLLKSYYIAAFTQAIRRCVEWESEEDFSFSDATLKKALKELNYYNQFNSLFCSNLNGENNNIDVFKKVLLKGEEK